MTISVYGATLTDSSSRGLLACESASDSGFKRVEQPASDFKPINMGLQKYINSSNRRNSLRNT